MVKKEPKIKSFNLGHDFSKILNRYSEKIDLYTWANKYREMPMGTSSLTGTFSVDYVPPAIEIYKTFDTCNDITLMMPTQLLKTEFIINAILYISHKDPSPIILLEPSEDLAKEIAVQRIIPSLRSCEPLAKLSQLTTAYGIATHKKRENTEVISLANGATIFFNTPQQKGGVISKPIRFAFYDEIDRSDRDVSQLLRDRLNTYGNKAKFIDCSSPVEESQSIIFQRWKTGSAGTYKILCPSCKTLTTPDLSSLIANDKVAYIQCHECKQLIDENQRMKAVRLGMYIHERPDLPHKSFTASQLCSPFLTVQKIYNSQQLAISETRRTGDEMYMQNFIQSNFAQPFSRKINFDDSLYSLALFDSGDTEVPENTLIITASIDVQANRLEGEVCAWSLDEERLSCHGVKYFVIMSDRRLAKNKNQEEVEIYAEPSSRQFGEAVKIIHNSWRLKGSDELIPVSRVCVDSGYATHMVMTACEQINSTLDGRVWLPVKGQSSPSQQMIKTAESKSNSVKHSRIKSNISTNIIYTDSHKAMIYAMLEHDRNSQDFKYFTWNTNESAGYCENGKLKRAYLEGLYSEVLATKKGSSRKKYYVKISDDIRNEPLDLKVYALSALYFLSRDYEYADPAKLLSKLQSGKDIEK